MPDYHLSYAAYGSNLHPERLGRRIDSATFRGTAFVDGWSLAFHKRGKDGSGKASLATGGGAHVAVYSISASDKPTLDAIEHAGIGYRETAIDVPGFGECFTYVSTESHIDDELAPFCWYHALVMAGADFHDFPQGYVETIRAVGPLRDPDDERRRRNWALVHALSPG